MTGDDLKKLSADNLRAMSVRKLFWTEYHDGDFKQFKAQFGP